MNLNSIFELFNSENEDKFSNDESSLLVDFSEHPLFWISGFNKVIDNHMFFKKYATKAYNQIAEDLKVDIEELEKAGEELMFRKAWDYIKYIKLDNNFHIDCIKLKATDSFVNNLQEAILFFESLEEYEKCALLKGVENKVKEFLK